MPTNQLDTIANQVNLLPPEALIQLIKRAAELLEQKQSAPLPAKVDYLPLLVLFRSAWLRATTKLKLLDAIHLATALRQQCDSFLTNDAMFRTLNLPQIKILSDLNLL